MSKRTDMIEARIAQINLESKRILALDSDSDYNEGQQWRICLERQFLQSLLEVSDDE